MSSSIKFAFQHFDKEFDFGIINEQGERVRKRKTPGRKPNPPSLQQKRAKNRISQRTFRDREQQRKEEKEKERFVFNQEIKNLKRELAIVQFEARYLKACVLHLTMACLIHQGAVPHIWSESRIIPSNNHGEYKNPVFGPYNQCGNSEASQIPALLDMILENELIVDFDKASSAIAHKTTFSNYLKKNYNTSTNVPLPPYQAYISEHLVTLNQKSQVPERNFPQRRSKKASDKIKTKSSHPLQQQGQGIYSPLLSSDSAHTLFTDSSTTIGQRQTDDIFIALSSPDQQENHGDHCNYPKNTATTSSQEISIPAKPIVGVIYDPPALRTSADFANMPALQALHILRLQLKLTSILGSMITASLLPTALQRVIPHDIRIDYIPSAAIRDRMIIFQDYYSIDDCFQFLTENTVFMGGDVRDTRNWVIDPEYSLKYWFICHQLVEHTYDDCIDKERVDIINNKYSSNSDLRG